MPALLLLSVIPSVALAAYVCGKDKESEPTGLLVSLFGLGVLSIVPALIGEVALVAPLELLFGDDVLVQVAEAYLFVATCEEGAKYIVLRSRTWRHPAFDHSFDGIIYASMVALGFATFENVMYVMESGFGTALVRGITAVPAHAAFGVVMGLEYGMARVSASLGEERERRRHARNAFLYPALMHGTYDGLIFASVEFPILMPVMVAFVVMMDVVVVRMIGREARNDYVLPPMPGVWIPPTMPSYVQAPYVAQDAAWGSPPDPYRRGPAPDMRQCATRPGQPCQPHRSRQPYQPGRQYQGQRADPPYAGPHR